jgi:YidC/Oxa1 family membrane protein insertase
MEKRTRIAVLLIALILGANLTFTAYTQKKRLQQQQARRAAEIADSLAKAPPPATIPPPDAAPPGVAAQTTPPAAGAGPGSGATAGAGAQPGALPAAPPETPSLFPVAAADAADLVIETPLQRIVLARAGGVVRSLQLQGFEVYDNGPVDLVPVGFREAGVGGLALRLRTPAGDLGLDAAAFEPEPGVFGADGVLRLDAGADARTVTLRATANGGGAIVKRYTFHPDQYVFDFTVAFEPGPALPRVDAYQLEWTTGMPITEGTAREDETRFRIAAAVGNDLVSKKTSDFKKAQSIQVPGDVHWACLQSKYFTVALIPAAPISGTTEMVGEARSHWIGMRLVQPTPWRGGGESYRVYAGPIDYDRIRALGVGLESTVELGWRWIRPISSAVLAFMEFLNKFIPNYGIIIIIVSVLAKLIFWPLTERSFRSMRRMQDMQPRMEEIRRRYKDDPRGMNEQMMAMYREQKINPVGGCMPMLVQMPMFFALFAALQSSVELRNAPFMGWIDNLAGPDVLARLPFSLPVIGNALSVLPFIMGATMVWQAKLTPSMGPQSGPQAAAMRQQAFLMRWIMPIMMTFFFYKMPSGLVIYWIVSTLMGIWQQWHINRKLGPPAQVVGVVAPKADGGGAGPATTRPQSLPAPQPRGRERSGRAGGRSA